MQETDTPEYTSFKFEDPRQERIYRNLYELIAPAPAVFYLDACKMMKDSTKFNTTSHIVSHLLREIEGFLLETLSVIPDEMPSSVDLTELKTDLIEISDLISDDNEKLSEIVTDKIVGEVERLLKGKLNSLSKSKKYSSKREKVQSIMKSLQIQESDQVIKAWLEELQGRAHRRYLDAPRKIDDEFKELLNKKENLFDVVLQALQNHYLKYIELLDMLLTKTNPTENDIDLLRKNIPNNLLTRNYFFNKLNEVGWLKPLRSKGFFKIEPQLVLNDETGSVVALAWPESQYLSLMSRFEPEEVCDIFLNEVPCIKNIWVLEDFIDAAIQMPPEIACKMTDKMIEWSQLIYPLYLPKKLGMLIVHFAKSSKIEYALRLAETLLEIMPDPKINDALNTAEYQLSPEPQSRFDQNDFSDMLREVFPELIEVAGIKAFDLLCNMLESAILLSQREPNEGIRDISYSAFWRPRIDRPSNRESLKDMLLDVVLLAINQIAEKNGSQVSTLVQLIDTRPYGLFKRIAIHILIQYPKTTHDLIVAYLNNTDILNDIGMIHECTLLLKENYKTLNSGQQEIIHEWIKEGPDLDRHRNSREKLNGIRPSDEDASAYRKRWQRDRLALIERDLPTKLKKILDNLVKEMGEPRSLEDDSCETYCRMGSTSPIEAKELKEMTTKDVIAFLKSWEAADDFFGPSKEGFYSVLKEIIIEDPERFAKNAVEFQSLDPIYINALILGLRDAIDMGEVFDWSLVISLCSWVISKYASFEIAIESDTYNSDLKSTCHYIVELLSIGLEDRKGEIPIYFRSKVWQIIEILSEDPDPTPETEAKYISRSDSSRNLADFSIRTTRGEAIIAAIKYALWVNGNSERSPINFIEKSTIDFDTIPEVRRVLEKHLDFSMDSSLAIRAIYGMHFPFLVYLDYNWALNNLSSIFPLEKTKQSLFEVAWGTYLKFCRPHIKIAKILKDQYSIAVEWLKLITDDHGQFLNQYDHIECNLAEHLMVLYWIGEIGLDDSLILRFWDNAPESLREYALQFMGFSLKHTEGDIPTQVLERFKDIWEFRYKIVSESDRDSNELRSFSWWFLSDKFDDAWKLAQFEKALNLIEDFRLDLLVAEKLAKLSSDMPLESLKCLDLIIRKTKNKSRIHIWRKSAEITLVNALNSEDPESRLLAKNLINYLCSIRYLEFRCLLKADS